MLENRYAPETYLSPDCSNFEHPFRLRTINHCKRPFYFRLQQIPDSQHANVICWDIDQLMD